MNGTKIETCPMGRHRIQNIHNGKVPSGTVKAGGQDKKAPGTYIKWDAPGVETIQPGEQEKIKDVSDQFNRFQMMNFNEHMHCLRGTHLKTQGCVMGKFIVHENLPEHLAQGMFKKPGAYDVIMRYSSLTPKIVPDCAPAPRGIGMKIFGVEGEKIWGEDKKTQDWTFNNYPILELRDPQTTYDIADSLERNWNDLPKFAEEQSNRVDADVATLGGQLPRQHMVAMPEYSQSAYRHGPYVAKYGVFPLGDAQKALVDTEISESDPINVISQNVRSFHQNNKVTYSFCAQLLQDLAEQPVDDIGIEWDPKKYPFEQIATLEFEPQDSWLPEFRTWWDDRITVNTWHGLKEHQPLGSTNRMRRVVYAESRKLRLRVNGYRDYVEPGSIKEVPAPLPAPQLAMRYQDAVQTVEVK
ncbi:catalase-like domain-containing protein [Paraphoma chrysanthemicola]|nr:catalase-like domain-containing protein [Paraphoma chrysanthemicola]